MSACSWMNTEMPQRQCKWPGVFSSSLHGDHKWKCYWHHKLAGENRSLVQIDGNLIVRQSYEWDGSPESYFAARAARPALARDAGEDQGRREVSAPVTDIPRRVSELVADLQPEYDREF